MDSPAMGTGVMTVRQLRESFSLWSAQEVPLVLATVYHTQGSTYSKAGARMLITGDGRFQGMLSGGCLEGDLAERASQVIDSGAPQTVTYDLGMNDEELWGLGVGCDGLMRIFLQPLTSASAYQPFAAMDEILGGDEPGIAATVIQSSIAALTAGATLLRVADTVQTFGIATAHQEALSGPAAAALAAGQSCMQSIGIDGESVDVLFALLLPPPRLLLLGAGLDARPVLRLATELGWRVSVQDHRPAYVAGGGFDDAERVLCKPASQLADAIDFARFDAVIVMSHHLATDRVYLQQLARTSVPYVGLLGPPDRRRRLMADLGDDAKLLEARLHGPAGLDIGGDGPASIALSIIAQVHDELIGRSGRT
jgi:xanthine/CO dehydrogenase XdhC/CoxF family maturation factor